MTVTDIDWDDLRAAAIAAMESAYAPYSRYRVGAAALVSDGRITYNIWETPAQLAAGDAAVADWVKQNPVSTQEGATEVYTGTIGYSDILGTA